MTPEVTSSESKSLKVSESFWPYEVLSAGVVRFLQFANIVSAPDILVKLLLESARKVKDGKVTMLGEICPDNLFTATLIVVNDLHEKILSGKFPVKLLLPRSSV
ncbi:hypothetical protein KSS87_023837 [Heliosperma pusillum]|nr:hypothetical protein KSS87_000591 [Heliosperma pusillum]KAH9620625.1 hypothetical protein KSS87_023837 [Heliosperma pusillum]